MNYNFIINNVYMLEKIWTKRNFVEFQKTRSQEGRRSTTFQSSKIPIDMYIIKDSYMNVGETVA